MRGVVRSWSTYTRRVGGMSIRFFVPPWARCATQVGPRATHRGRSATHRGTGATPCKASGPNCKAWGCGGKESGAAGKESGAAGKVPAPCGKIRRRLPALDHLQVLGPPADLARELVHLFVVEAGVADTTSPSRSCRSSSTSGVSQREVASVIGYSASSSSHAAISSASAFQGLPSWKMAPSPWMSAMK